MPQQENCSKDFHHSGDGLCCKPCDAGTYKGKDCDRTTDTQCVQCERGRFMATSNYLSQCRDCKKCNSNNKKTLRECTAREDTVCQCDAGFYCNNVACDYCHQVTPCEEGKGVKIPASRTNDTICAPCESGFFSNVSDHISPCKPHTRCEDLMKELKTQGTFKTDAVCGQVRKPQCSWMLPAGLWVGLVLTSALLFAVALVLWRRRKHRRLHRVNLSLAETPVSEVLAEKDQLKLPLPSEPSGLFQEETYTPSYTCDLPAYEPDEMEISCDGPNLEDSSVPITPLKASVSFMDSSNLNGSSIYCASNYHRTMSEPQEDEWCGT